MAAYLYLCVCYRVAVSAMHIFRMMRWSMICEYGISVFYSIDFFNVLKCEYLIHTGAILSDGAMFVPEQMSWLKI